MVTKPFTYSNLPGTKICLLSHYAAVDSGFNSVVDFLHQNSALQSILGPQHGYWGETQDNMIEWEGYSHPKYSVPVNSLYGETRTPTDSMLSGADSLLIDLVDVGSRYYTYIYSMALSMRKCAELSIPVSVLDRPNPLGNRLVEGPILDRGLTSFVGLYPIPVRHALTIGELALLFAELDGLPRPEILGYQNTPEWVMPSPNMPTVDTALVYPGMCLFEATNLSEGRGTTRPFEIFGAPWINPFKLCESLNGSIFMKGATLRPHYFIPTFNKHAGCKCGGAQIHVTDASSYRPFLAGLGILNYSFKLPATKWNPPPYEYEYKKLPIDILAGDTGIREAINNSDEQKLISLSKTPGEKWLKSVRNIVTDTDRFVFD